MSRSVGSKVRVDIEKARQGVVHYIMARRQQSVAEDLIELTSRLPWWAGVLLAAGSYVWLHSIASKGIPQASGGDLALAMRGGMFYGFASLGQYVLPFLFGLGAFLSLVMSAKRKKLHDDVTKGDLIVSDISWQDFELLIAEHFRRQGFTVRGTGPGADGGVDLVLTKDAAKYLVQCKQWKAYKVGVKIVRELLGTMVGTGAAGGYVVTSGQFTKDAVAFARENNIELLEGKHLRRILKASQEISREVPSSNNGSKTTDFSPGPDPKT